MNQNLPVSQFYHVSVDDKDPYRVYGGLQDNSTWTGPSAYGGGITNADAGRTSTTATASGRIVDPTDPEVVYAEGAGRLHRPRSTAAPSDSAGYPAQGVATRRSCASTGTRRSALSPTQTRHVLYIGAQFLFRSRDRGDSWERISPTSPPTTRRSRSRSCPAASPWTTPPRRRTPPSTPSPSRRWNAGNVIWVGTDDGNVQLTPNDGGKSWTNVVGNIRGPAQELVGELGGGQPRSAPATALRRRSTGTPSGT